MSAPEIRAGQLWKGNKALGGISVIVTGTGFDSDFKGSPRIFIDGQDCGSDGYHPVDFRSNFRLISEAPETVASLILSAERLMARAVTACAVLDAKKAAQIASLAAQIGTVEAPTEAQEFEAIGARVLGVTS